MTTELCKYGCGQIAQFKNKSGNLMCADHYSKCPAVRKRNSEKNKSLYADGHRRSGSDVYQTLPSDIKNKMAWAKGLTKETSEAVARNAKVNSKPRKEETTKLAKERYRQKCKFNITQNDIQRIIGYDLLVTHGMYNKHTNPNGVVRDHRLSIHEAFEKNLDPSVVGHPANCEFVLHKKNAAKTFKSSITIDELYATMAKW